MTHLSRHPETPNWHQQRWHPHPTWQGVPSSYTTDTPYNVAPTPQQHHHPESPLLQIPYGSARGLSTLAGEAPHSPAKLPSHSPPIKSELYDTPKDFKILVENPAGAHAQEHAFATSIDRLLKVMQQKTNASEEEGTVSPSVPPPINETAAAGSQAKVDEGSEEEQKEKPYVCRRKKCRKRFSQTTHLRIHERSHTGERPHKCSFAGCGGSFTQKGNLRTHERRHLGERPFKCKVPGCTRAFPQKGNLKAHEDTHFKRNTFRCVFKSCGKTFSSKGNLKTHQNNYHKDEIRALELKFANISSVDEMSEVDRELWDYFSTVHNNSNKGIKGRGKKCKVELIPQAGSGSLPSPGSLQAAAEFHNASFVMASRNMPHPMGFHPFGIQRNSFSHGLMFTRGSHGYEAYDMGDQTSLSEGTMTPASSPGGILATWAK
ncbi:hypothetical protein F5Y17DRAFT_474773 [Xylariaceae sp. FL0594]|nr:hypothetical protein F5Y17DRAFT_474773 [Xylariaceae sp. FL0594]